MKAAINLSLFGVSVTLILAALFFAFLAPKTANAVYVLTANVSAAGTCFIIEADNNNTKTDAI